MPDQTDSLWLALFTGFAIYGIIYAGGELIRFVKRKIKGDQ